MPKRLIEIADVIRGVSFDKGETRDSPAAGFSPILRAGNITEELVIDRDLVWVPDRFISRDQFLRAGDIAICMSSGSQSVVGKTAALERDWTGSVGAFCAIIRPHANKILPEFLRLFLLSPNFRSWTATSSGANIKNIRKSELEAFPVQVPSPSEQRRIIDILSRAEGIVRLRREAQQKAADLIPAILVDMFGDPDANPRGWPVVSLGSILASADYGTSKKASDDGSGVPMIRMGNVGYDGALNLSDLKHVVLSASDIERFGLRKGDVLFNRTNSKDLVGKTGLWDGSREAVAASYFIRLRTRDDLLNPSFLWATMNTKYMKRVLFQTARGAIGQANINSKELKALPIALPPLELQEAFARRIAQVSSLTTRSCEATAVSRAILTSLRSVMFKGADA